MISFIIKIKEINMWSDRYYYLNIYKDENLSESVSTSKVKELISSIPELVESGEFEFKNREGFPFIDVTLLNVKSTDSWSSNDADAEKTNFIPIECAKGQEINFDELKKVFIQIAEGLGWMLVDERTDDEIDNFVLWDASR